MKVDVERFGFNNLLQEFRFKVLKKVITTETFNVDFYNKFIKWSVCHWNFEFPVCVYIYQPFYVI